MMNNTINEIKNSLEGISSRITKAEERISDLEDKIVKITTAEQKQEKRMKRRYSNCKYLCTQHRSTSIHKANANSHKRGNRL